MATRLVSIALSHMVWVALARAGSFPAQAGESDSVGLEARVDSLLVDLVAANEFSGAIALARQGEILYQRGFGMANHEVELPFTQHTPADGGSLAKTFTAAGVWWLVQEGRIELDAPVVRYLPEYPHEATTVRHLIGHMNGLPPGYEYFDPYFASDEVRTTEALLRVVAEHAPEPSFSPGSRFEYSNLGYDAAALVIERVTGTSYPQFVAERFFVPLDMEASFARPARLSDWPGVRTRGYRWREGAWELHDVWDMEAFLGASNLYFSAIDLCRWGNANALGTALPPEVFAMGQERLRIDGHPSPITGLSWYCDDAGNRGYYTGSVAAFHSFVYWDRSRGESVAFVCNSSLPPWETITLQRDLVAVLAGRRTHSRSEDERFDRIERARISGVYEADEIGDLTVAVEEDRMRLQIDSGLEFDVFPVGRNVFYVPGTDFWLGFRGSPEPTMMHVRSMFVDVTAARSR